MVRTKLSKRRNNLSKRRNKLSKRKSKRKSKYYKRRNKLYGGDVREPLTVSEDCNKHSEIDCSKDNNCFYDIANEKCIAKNKKYKSWFSSKVVQSENYEEYLTKKSSYLIYAIYNKNIQRVNNLLSTDAPSEDPNNSKLVNMFGKDYINVLNYPILAAAYTGNTDIVNMLINRGADINLNHVGNTPLVVASREGHYNVVDILIKKGANIEYGYKPPLLIAAEYGHQNIVDLLIKEGATINPSTRSGWSPLTAAANAGETDIVSFLIEKGANCCDKDGNNRTPLLIAAFKGHTDLVKLLIDICKSVKYLDTRDSKGRTALMYANYYHGETEISDLLIKAGATDNLTDYYKVKWPRRPGHHRQSTY